MSKQHDGGPAFPVWELNGQGKPEMTGFGMTLRDYFAAKAMQTMLTSERGTFGELAYSSYAMADAMLAARNAKEGA